MATQKITQAQWDTIGRHVLKQTGGITGLMNTVIHVSDDRYPTLANAAKRVPAEGYVLIYEMDKVSALNRWKIAAHDPHKKYDDLVARAVVYLVQDYLKKHNYELYVDRSYGNNFLGVRSKKTGKVIKF